MIKKIVILVLLVLGAYLVQGQAPTVFFGEINKGVKARSSLWADSAVYLGVMDTNFIPLRPGAIVFKSNDRRFYGWDGIWWKELGGNGGSGGGGGDGDFIDSVTLYGIRMCQWKRGVSTCYDIDTNLISTKYYVTNYVDNAISNIYYTLGIDSSKRLISGGAVIDNGFNGHTSNITFKLGGKVWGVAGTPFTLLHPNPLQSRYALGVVDTLGNFGIQYCPYGTVNVALCEETDPGSQLIVVRYYIPAGATTPLQVFSMLVYNEGVVPEWTVSGTARWNKFFAPLPFDGAVSLRDTTVISGTYIDFTYPRSIPVDTFTLGSFYLKLYSVFNNNTKINISLMLGNSVVSLGSIPLNSGSYGFDRNVINSWQPIIWPKSAFTGGFTGGRFDRIRLSMSGTNNTSGIGIDKFILQHDNGANVGPPAASTFTFQGMDFGTPRPSPVTLLKTDIRGFVDNATYNADTSLIVYWNNGQPIFQQPSLFKYITEGYGINLDTLIPRNIRVATDTLLIPTKQWVINYVALYGGGVGSDTLVKRIYVTPDSLFTVVEYTNGKKDSTQYIGGGGGSGGGNIIENLQQTTDVGKITTNDITVNSNIKIWRGLTNETKSIGIGDSTLRAITGTQNYNIAIGAGAMKKSTDAGENIAIGVDALSSNTTGDYNFAMGTRALATNTTANSNFAIGYEALVSNTSGTWNQGIGTWSLRYNTTGAGNVGIGPYAMHGSYLGITGSYNTAVGAATMDSLSTGAENTATGYFSSLNLKTGVQNSSYGVSSMRYNISGSQNSAFGRYTLWEATSTVGNTVFGFESGRYSYGNYNVFLGYQSGYAELGSNKLYIENTSTSTPLIWGDFLNDSVRINGHFSVKDGTQGAGKVFTSDANGSGSWQTPSGGGGGGGDAYLANAQTFTNLNKFSNELRVTASAMRGAGTGFTMFNTTDETTNYEGIRMYYETFDDEFYMEAISGGTGLKRALNINGVRILGNLPGWVQMQNLATNGISSPTSGYFPLPIKGTPIELSNFGAGAASGDEYIVKVHGNIGQSGTAGYTAFRVSPLETSLGSGSKLLIDLGTNTLDDGTGTHTSVFNVTNTGLMNLKAYGLGAVSGTAVYGLGVTATGQVVETAVGGGGSGGSNWTNTGANIWRNSKVGIGVVPTEMLHIRKDTAASTVVRIQNLSAGVGAQAAIIFNNDIASDGVIGIYGSNSSFGPLTPGSYYMYYNGPAKMFFGNAGGGNMSFATANGGPFVERISIAQVGYVGIGTTAPTVPLDVYKVGIGSGFSVARFVSNGSGYSSPYEVSIQSQNTSTWLEILNSGGANKGAFFGMQDDNFEVWNYQGGHVKFYTSPVASTGNPRMIIHRDGMVGINTLTPDPSAQLELQSTSKGFLPPRMSGAQAEAISSPATGLMVFITVGDGTTITSSGWWGWTSSTWYKF